MGGDCKTVGSKFEPDRAYQTHSVNSEIPGGLRKLGIEFSFVPRRERL